MNPCPCGWYGDPVKECTCSDSMVSRYQKRISGPLLDRIDIHMDVPRVEYEKLSDHRLGEPSAAIQARVEAARERQRRRFQGRCGLLANADMGPAEVRDSCPVDEAGKSLLRAAMQQLHMSARAYDELYSSSPHPQAGANHRRPGRLRHHRDAASGGGYPIPAQETNVAGLV